MQTHLQAGEIPVQTSPRNAVAKRMKIQSNRGIANKNKVVKKMLISVHYTDRAYSRLLSASLPVTNVENEDAESRNNAKGKAKGPAITELIQRSEH